VSHYAVQVHHNALAETIEKYRTLPRGRLCKDADYEDPASMTEGFRNCNWILQYAAMIENLDSSLGSIMDAVDKAGIGDNTYIIFSSDNGGGFRDNGPLSGGKARMFEGGLRVPTVVRGPGVLKNTQCDVPVVQWDLLPTLHDLGRSAKPLPEGVDGGSWRDLLRGGNKGQVQRPIPGLVFHYPYYAGVPIQAIRMGDYKFMRQLNTNETRLHNVVTDIGEKRNLVKDMPERAAAMDAVLQQYLKDVDAEKIEDMYAARFEELEGYKKRVREEIARRRAELAAGKDRAKNAERVGFLLEKEIPRLNRQVEETRRNTKRTDWM